MSYLVYEKIVVSGKYLEHYSYQKPVKRDHTPERIPTIKQPSLFEKQQRQKEYRQKSINRTKTKLRRLINSNSDFNLFFTLTFKENLSDIKRANLQFAKFVKRLNYYLPDVKYLSVPEYQKRGAVHYHVLLSIPKTLMPQSDFLFQLSLINSSTSKSLLFSLERDFSNRLWKHGFVKIKPITTVENLGIYLTKYLTKDINDNRMFGKKRFFYSQNLEKPKELVGHFASLLFQFVISLNLSPVLNLEFFSEILGKVKYSVFCLSDNLTNFKHNIPIYRFVDIY